MGESIVAASHEEDKMGETAKSVPALDVSVSFGRFENDSLSWEKWSSFSPNKYLEEVGKCATPGSVAKKKAYFEAHYKKIAARKAEQLDQTQMEHDDSMRTDDPNSEDLDSKTYWEDSELAISSSENSAEGVKQETIWDDELGNDHFDKHNEDAAIEESTKGSLEPPDLLVGTMKEEFGDELYSPVVDKEQEVALVKEELASSLESQDKTELPENMEADLQRSPVMKEQNVSADSQKESQKVNTNTIIRMTKVTDVARVKKKLPSPVKKAPQVSTPKVSKPVSASSSLSASQSSTRKVTGSSLPKSKVPSVADNKKVAPKALHMSLSMDPPNADPAPLTTDRKIFIMEKMGDKDIVKRAFKTFQNNYNQLKSSAEGRSIGAKQPLAKGSEVKVSTSMTPRKEHTGSIKAGGMDKKGAKAAPSSIGLKNEERAEKRKEFPKKFEEKSNAKESGSIYLQTKSKKEKEADIRKLRHSFNFKATPLPSFYHGQKVSKSPIDKEGSKTLRI